IDAHLVARPQQQSGAWLSTVAVAPVPRSPEIRMMRAIVDPVDPRAVLPEESPEALMGFLHEILREIASRDSGLIGHDHRLKAGLVGESHGLGAAGQESKAIDVVD